MLGIERDDETGRFPERDERMGYVMPLVELQRQRLIRQAVEDDIEVVATNSDGDGGRRNYLLGLLGPGSTEEVLDPGIQVVQERLTVNGTLSNQCGNASGEPLVFEVDLNGPTPNSRLNTEKTTSQVLALGDWWDQLVVYEKTGEGPPGDLHPWRTRLAGDRDHPEPATRPEDPYSPGPVPFVDGDEVRIDAKMPNTGLGRDAIELVRTGTATGLSIEFQSRL